MLGLIKKDLIVMKRNFKPIQLLMIMVCIIPLSQNPQFAIPILSMIIVFFISTSVISVFSYDESAKWNQYEPILPFTRNKIVAERYVLAVIFSLVSAFIALVVSFFISVFEKVVINEILYFSIMSLFVAFIYFSVMIPSIYKFGVEAGRNMLYFIILIPVAVATLMGIFKVKINLDFISHRLFLPSIVFAVFLIFGLSYLLSVRIYLKKEF